MATDDRNSVESEDQELSDKITCCICTNVYADPKALPCIHTYCMNCLQEMGLKMNKEPGDVMPCPICRRLFKIPPEGFSGLPNNFFIAKLVQLANVSNLSKSSKAYCDACLDGNEGTGKEEIPEADLYCAECKQNLCEECCRHHRKLKLTKNHKLMQIPDQQVNYDQERDKNAVLTAERVCELHEGRLLEIYCVECETVNCAVCFFDDHREHESYHVSKYVDGFRKQIDNNIEVINQCYYQAQMRKSELTMAKEDMQQKVEKLEEDVINKREELKRLADSHANFLLQSVSSLRQSKLKEIEIESGDVDAHLSCLQSYNSDCQNITANGSASDIWRAVADLNVKAAELQEQCQSLLEREIQSFKFSLIESEFEEFLDCENMIGVIEEDCDSNQWAACTLESSQECEAHQTATQDLLKGVEQTSKDLEKKRTGDDFRYNSDPVLVQTIKRNVAEVTKPINGLAILEQELFVFSGVSSAIEIYDLIEFSFSRRLILKQNLCRSVYDMISCSQNKCLYILDYESKKILRIDPKGKLINKWSTGSDSGWRLSVTKELSVILPIHNKNKLKEFSPDGKLIREISLSCADIRHPWHAIKLANGHFVVSHGFYYDDLHRVCMVDPDGKLMKLFGGYPGSTIGQMNVPVHLSVDRNDFVLIADRDNHRILLLDSDLKFMKEILRIWLPNRILLDESNSRLVVADNEGCNSRISIFDLN